MWCIRSHCHIWKKIQVCCYSTIFALSSGQGKCGVAVFRISGRRAREAIFQMAKFQSLPEPRKAVLTSIMDPVTGEKLDRGIILWFPGPKSFTSEDVCEFQVHGGPAVVASMLKALAKLPEFRLAESGEFTKRAFLSGKMDLTEVEGLSDLIHAETEQQRRQALLQMEGSLTQLYASWRNTLLRCVAHIEAYIDFSEDENIEEGILEKAKSTLQNLLETMKAHLEDSIRGERLHDGVRTIIIGETNVGKSSLLNYLVKRPAAIVTSIPGTTRDIVEVPIDIGGYPLLIADTAGQRTNPADAVELEGIKRALAWSRTADLILLVIDAREILVNNSLENYLCNYKNKFGLEDKNVVYIINKTDLLSTPNFKSRIEDNIICISCKTLDGMTDLQNLLTNQLKELCGNPCRESPTFTQERHRHHIANCVKNLEDCISFRDDYDIPLAAHKLRQSMNHLGRITGHVTSEEVLDVIFKDFCIGK